jgi:serine/threonine-protein kinase
MIGQTVSHYKITEKLGDGGMGVVYKAVDTKLDRLVALKFLRPELTSEPNAKQRFVHEARAASALQHNNICTIHEIDEIEDGHVFIAMDCYEGETLKQKIARGPLPVDEAVDIVSQVAEGLARAHAAGMVHRDIKPANIIITRDGVVKIVDFGLAKLAGQTRVTKTGAMAGTIVYMSPEQAMGTDVDHRSDIFSLGAVFYEMLTGDLPFKGDHEAAVLYGIIHNDPEPLAKYRSDITEGLQRMAGTALRKEPGERYQNASEIAADLKRFRESVPTIERRLGWAKHNLRQRISIALVSILIVIGGYIVYSRYLSPQASESAVASIVVLPFINLSSEPDDEYFSDGITEDLIHALAKVDDLRVVSRTSAFQFKGKTADIRDIGKKLGAGTVLEGTVRKSGDELVITANLIDVADGLEIWSERFEMLMSDVFTIQNQISLTIVEKMQLQLAGGQADEIIRPYTENIDAYTLYLKGRYQWNIRSLEALEKARQLFEQAVAIDTKYALAYSGLADVYLMMANYSNSPTDELYLKARVAARKAIDIDPGLAEAHVSYALVSWIFDWDWQTANKEFARAVELKPAYATTYHWRAMFLAFMGRFDDAVAEIERALAKDPVSLIINAAAGLLLYCGEDFDAAIEQCFKTLDMDPEFNPAVTTLARAYIQTGKYDEAISWLEKSIRLAGRRTYTLALLAYAFALAGKHKEAMDILVELQSEENKGKVDPYDMVIVNIGLGDSRAALDWLQRSGDHRGFGIFNIQADPALAGFRNTPEYTTTMKTIGFPIP